MKPKPKACCLLCGKDVPGPTAFLQLLAGYGRGRRKGKDNGYYDSRVVSGVERKLEITI